MTDNLMSIGIGGAMGVGSRLAANYDAKKGETKFFKKIDNYVSFGIPLVAAVAAFTDFLPIPKNIAEKALVAGSVLAGIKGTELMTKKNYKLVYSSTPATWKASGRAAAGYSNPASVRVIQNETSGELALSATGMGSL